MTGVQTCALPISSSTSQPQPQTQHSHRDSPFTEIKPSKLNPEPQSKSKPNLRCDPWSDRNPQPQPKSPKSIHRSHNPQLQPNPLKSPDSLPITSTQIKTQSQTQNPPNQPKPEHEAARSTVRTGEIGGEDWKVRRRDRRQLSWEWS